MKITKGMLFKHNLTRNQSHPHLICCSLKKESMGGSFLPGYFLNENNNLNSMAVWPLSVMVKYIILMNFKSAEIRTSQ